MGTIPALQLPTAGAPREAPLGAAHPGQGPGLLAVLALALFDITSEEVDECEGPDDLGVVLAEAAAHLAPGAQVHDLPDQLLTDVHLHLRGALAEAEPRIAANECKEAAQ